MGVWRGPRSIRENGVEWKTPKTKKNKRPPHCSNGKATCSRDHESDPRFDTPARPKFLKFALVRENVKMRPRFCSPKAFLGLKTQFRQKIEGRKNKFLRGPNIVLKHVSKIKSFQDVEEEFWTRTGAKSLPNPLFWSVRRLWTSSTSPPWTDTPKTKKKPPRKSLENEGGPWSSKMALSKTPDFTTAFFRREICKMQTPNFTLQNKECQKPRAAY